MTDSHKNQRWIPFSLDAVYDWMRIYGQSFDNGIKAVLTGWRPETGKEWGC